MRNLLTSIRFYNLIHAINVYTKLKLPILGEVLDGTAPPPYTEGLSEGYVPADHSADHSGSVLIAAVDIVRCLLLLRSTC